MTKSIVSLEVRVEQDVVLARQRTRLIAQLLGFDAQDQTRIATAVSEIVRNAFRYAGGGRVEFLLDQDEPPAFLIAVRDRGPGIADLDHVLSGNYQSNTGMGMGLIGVRRLMDRFHIETGASSGTTVQLGKDLSRRAIAVGASLAKITAELARLAPQDQYEEIQQQNQELLTALQQLNQNRDELLRLNRELETERANLKQVNRELEDTNRGVVALYAELDEKADFLRRASETKSRFLANMSHEFRTPLNSITGLSRVLLDRMDGELTEEQEKQVRLIRKSAQDLTELVNDLLDIAKVEAGKVTVKPIEFTVDGLFGALRGMLRPLLGHNSSVSLNFDVPKDIEPLHTDDSKVSQILRNFISNALKFTEAGEIRVSARDEGDGMIRFSVSDTGIGVAPQDFERIFEEFAQVDSPRQKRTQGTGLGLPLVRKLANLLGGHVELQSELGVGSTFSVVLPKRYSGPVEVSFAPSVSPQIDSSRLPVLTIEDNRETLFIYEKYLKGTEFQIVPARTLHAARRALGQFRPVAIILDVLLEGENTWEMLAEVKRSANTRDIPVFVVTLVENEHKSIGLGADGFHAKPIERTWLLNCLQQAKARYRPPTLLIVDDTEASRYLLKNILAPTHAAIVEATTGVEGLLAARRDAPQGIFLDMELPDRSGLEVLEQLRREPVTRNIPILIHTSKVLSDEEERRLKASGVTAVLSKDHASLEKSTADIQDALLKAGLIVEKWK